VARPENKMNLVDDAVNEESVHDFDEFKATGFAVAGNKMGLLASAIEALEVLLAEEHGAGPWDASGAIATGVTTQQIATSEEGFIALIRGDTNNLTFHFYEVTTRSPLDLSGYTLWLTIKHSHYRDDEDNEHAVCSKEMDLVDGESAVATVALLPSDLADMPINDVHDYDVEARTGEIVRTLIVDSCVLSHDVRR